MSWFAKPARTRSGIKFEALKQGQFVTFTHEDQTKVGLILEVLKYATHPAELRVLLDGETYVETYIEWYEVQEIRGNLQFPSVQNETPVA